MPGRVRIGISGWTYKGWRGKFYPSTLPHKKELAYAASLFSSIEINGTHYSLQRPSSFLKWAEETPDDFVFSVKASRYITHMLKLRNVEAPLANFFASGLLALGHKLGPILWQFSPRFVFDAAKLDAFFSLLPRTAADAAALARLHDSRLKGRAFTEPIGRSRPIRYAIEIRHDSFRSPEFIALLRRHRIALVCADTVDWPRLMDLTADFVYCRLHGSEVLYTSGYSAADLDLWASRVATWARGGEVPRNLIPGWPTQAPLGWDRQPNPAARNDYASPTPARRRTTRDVYVYFDNDAKVYAPADAQNLTTRVNALLNTANAA
ncbi:MAG TPA: DUF72 domain-containing protein [Acidobacteriaceae bacterium]|nr:DUF72 domain-containing protein [Acidobacteriaceae bacterium]